MVAEPAVLPDDDPEKTEGVDKVILRDSSRRPSDACRSTTSGARAPPLRRHSRRPGRPDPGHPGRHGLFATPHAMRAMRAALDADERPASWRQPDDDRTRPPNPHRRSWLRRTPTRTPNGSSSRPRRDGHDPAAPPLVAGVEVHSMNTYAKLSLPRGGAGGGRRWLPVPAREWRRRQPAVGRGIAKPGATRPRHLRAARGEPRSSATGGGDSVTGTMTVDP